MSLLAFLGTERWIISIRLSEPTWLQYISFFVRYSDRLSVGRILQFYIWICTSHVPNKSRSVAVSKQSHFTTLSHVERRRKKRNWLCGFQRHVQQFQTADSKAEQQLHLYVISIKLKEETSTVLHLEHRFVWCWNLNISESRPEIPGKFWNMVLEKVGRSVGLIVWEMKKCYTESRRSEISYKH